MIAEVRLAEQLIDEILRRILGHGDLLQDDAALLLQILRIEGGVQQHVAQQVERLFKVLVDDLGVIAGALLGGKRVHLAADRVHLFGDLHGAALLCALEEHVLDEVRQAVFPARLKHRSRADPQPHADGAEMRDFFGDHAKAVGQRKFVVHGSSFYA